MPGIEEVRVVEEGVLEVAGGKMLRLEEGMVSGRVVRAVRLNNGPIVLWATDDYVIDMHFLDAGSGTEITMEANLFEVLDGSSEPEIVCEEFGDTLFVAATCDCAVIACKNDGVFRCEDEHTRHTVSGEGDFESEALVQTLTIHDQQLTVIAQNNTETITEIFDLTDQADFSHLRHRTVDATNQTDDDSEEEEDGAAKAVDVREGASVASGGASVTREADGAPKSFVGAVKAPAECGIKSEGGGRVALRLLPKLGSAPAGVSDECRTMMELMTERINTFTTRLNRVTGISVDELVMKNDSDWLEMDHHVRSSKGLFAVTDEATRLDRIDGRLEAMKEELTGMLVLHDTLTNATPCSTTATTKSKINLVMNHIYRARCELNVEPWKAACSLLTQVDVAEQKLSRFRERCSL